MRVLLLFYVVNVAKAGGGVIHVIPARRQGDESLVELMVKIAGQRSYDYSVVHFT